MTVDPEELRIQYCKRFRSHPTREIVSRGPGFKLEWEVAPAQHVTITNNTLGGWSEMWGYGIYKYHREDGPAIVRYDAEGDLDRVTWYFEGAIMEFSEYLENIKNTDTKKLLLEKWL